MPETATLTKIKNGVITLPPKLRGILEGVEDICIIPAGRMFIIKPIERPLKKLSNLASRVSSPSMSANEIQKVIQAYRAQP